MEKVIFSQSGFYLYLAYLLCNTNNEITISFSKIQLLRESKRGKRGHLFGMENVFSWMNFSEGG